ncbi:MAG TPA: undecaprenyl-diphosphate phosphatase [bacterium]|nr:undecaprenyl-diphosphate phosphatase [bacterium]
MPSCVQKRLWSITAVIGLVLLGSCGSGPPEGSELTFAFPSQPLTLDPARCESELDRILCTLLYGNLVQLNLDGVLDPEMVLEPDCPPGVDPEAWADLELERQIAVPNGLEFTFQIHPEVPFPDGRPASVRDVQYSFERLMDPLTQSPHGWVIRPILGASDFATAKQDQMKNLPADPIAVDGIVGIEEIDSTTFRFRLTNPYAPFLHCLTLPASGILPATESAAAIQDVTAQFPLASLGSGPWEPESIDPTREIVLKAKENHPLRSSIRTERLRFQIVNDPEEIERLFLNESVALIEPAPEQCAKWLQNAAYQDQIISATQPSTTLLGFNFRKTLFQDLRVRRKIRETLDISRMAGDIGAHLVVATKGLLPRSLIHIPHVVHSQEIPLSLEETRGSDWSVLTLISPSGTLFTQTAEQIRQDLEGIGASLDVRLLEKPEYEQSLQNGDFDLAILSVTTLSPDPREMLSIFLIPEGIPGGRNVTRYANPDYDMIVGQSDMTPGYRDRSNLYLKAEDLLRLDCAAVFLWHPVDFRVRHKWLSGFRYSPFPSQVTWNGMFHETNEKRYESPENLQFLEKRKKKISGELTIAAAVILGFVQGLTEFLPISSSGHLKIVEHLLGLPGGAQYLFFDCLLHVGTLLAVLLFYRADLMVLLKALLDAPKEYLIYFRTAKKERELSEPVAFLSYILIGTLVTGIFALIFKDILEILFDSLPAVGFALIMTGVLLLAAKNPRKQMDPSDLSFKTAAKIGLAQGFAITPGLSRSGTTIAVALILGVKRETAVRFSFLLSVPAIGGATLLEAMETTRKVALIPALAGAVMAFLSGLLFLWFLVLLVRKERFHVFAYYTIPLGLLVLFGL